jgi:hypothetical protein
MGVREILYNGGRGVRKEEESRKELQYNKWRRGKAI